MLKQVTGEAQLEALEDDLPDQAPEDWQMDEELTGVADKDLLKSLLSKSAPSEPFESEAAKSPKFARGGGDHLPDTLTEALQLPGDLYNSLFRFAVRLRNSKGGADLGFLKNAKNCRRASRGFNWFQPLDWMVGDWLLCVFDCCSLFF